MNRSGTAALVLAALLVACAGMVDTRSDPWRDAGSSFRDCAECPEMLVISSGSFVMGSPVSEAGRFEDEGPQHTVTFAGPFAVSTTPITRAQYEVFVRTTHRSDHSGCAR